MTEAGWTRQRPNREGVYWFRWSVSSRPLIVSVAKDDCAWRVLEMGNQYDGSLAGYSDGEWLGPITPDSYQQGRVEGLREAACYCRNEADRSWSNDEIAGYDQALYETAMALDSLAQQAQEGKEVGDAGR